MENNDTPIRLRKNEKLSPKIYAFVSGVTFRFTGGSETQFIGPIEQELKAYEEWVVSLETVRLTGITPRIRETPRSEYIPKLGKRTIRAAGVTSGYADDVHSRSEYVSQWESLSARLRAVTFVAEPGDDY
jgi:hypothetical protein